MTSDSSQRVERERWRLLHHVIRTFEPFIALLGLVWFVLMVIDLTRGLSPTLQRISNGIWVLFVIDFVAEFLVAPKKLLYLKRQWIVALSLAVPALRLLRFARFARIARAARAVRHLRLARTLTSINRAIAALRATFKRRGFGYVLLTTTLVTLGGAAAMYAFENPVNDPSGIHDYATAVWWTAMLMTTMGSAYWPQTGEGRVLCIVLALYAFAVFGYLTATLASYFIDRDASREDAAVAGAPQIEELRREIAALHQALVDRTDQSRSFGLQPSPTRQHSSRQPRS